MIEEQIKLLEIAKQQAAEIGNYKLFSAICQDIRELERKQKESQSE